VRALRIVIVQPHAFTVSDAGFFAGTVALLNSLHRNADGLPLTVLDRGLTTSQRRLLESHCEVVTGGRDRHGYLSKLEAPLLHARRSPDDAVVLVDSDVVVVGPVTEPLGAAAHGSVFAFAEPNHPERWFAEWTELFDLRAPLRRATSVNAGFVAFSPGRVPGLLERWEDLCELIAQRAATLPSWDELRGTRADPLWLSDQDALNALLVSEVPEGRVVLGARLALAMTPPELVETTVVDRETWACERQGTPVMLLHGVGLRKPWQPAAARELRRTAYLGALRRFLTGPDLAVRVPEHELVPWLRPGPRGTATRWTLHAYELPARVTRPWRHARRSASATA
jgi:hypothetical protein